MRVGFLLSGSLDTLTGGYIYDRQLVNHLKLKGHQVDVIQLPVPSHAASFLYNPTLWFSRQLNGSTFDVLLEDELDHPALFLANRRLKSRGNLPVISIVHNLRSCEKRAAWQNRFYRQIEYFYLRSVDGFIFNSRTTRNAVENLIGPQRSSVTACPGGDRLPFQITEAEIIERAKRPGPLRVLFLGNLFRNKGLHILLESLAKLPQNSYVLTVVGDLTMERAYVKAITEQIRERNLSGKVFITGPLNNGELATRLMDSHILAVPSFYEGYGIAYLEGMGFGLPAIATTAGAAGEIITQGRDGFLITPGDSTTLSRHLQSLHEDRNLLTFMSVNAFQRFKSHPTWQASGDKILDFLQACSQIHS